MQTYSKKVDFHSHYLPPAYYEYLRKYEDERPDNFDTPDWSEEKHIAAMDKLGVAYSLISISSPNLSRSDDNTEKDYARRINNEGAAFVGRYPNRLGLIAELPLPNVENALEEAKYTLDVLKTEGFGLATNYRGKYLGCVEFDPLMEFINDRKSLIIVHPMKPYEHYEGVNEGLPIPTFEFFVETTRVFSNLVLKDTFNRYPDIKWIFPHAGAFISLLSDRFNSFSLVMKLRDPLLTADFLGAMKHVYFDLAGFPLPKQLQVLKQNVPISHMVYGSDGPYTPDFATIALAGALEQTDQLTDREKQQVFTLNAINLIPRLSEIIGAPAGKIGHSAENRRFKQSNLWRRKLISSIYMKMLNNKSHP
jgi:predicted TIM-barrel fold metal-dependent hydrolase